MQVVSVNIWGFEFDFFQFEEFFEAESRRRLAILPHVATTRLCAFENPVQPGEDSLRSKAGYLWFTAKIRAIGSTKFDERLRAPKGVIELFGLARPSQFPL